MVGPPTTQLNPAKPDPGERERPGELIHIDIKKLGRFDHVGHRITGDRRGQSKSRGIGWEFVHVGIDDASHLAFSQILPASAARQSKSKPPISRLALDEDNLLRLHS